jgi:hypothetical protein
MIDASIQEAPMGPFLILVLAGFALFIVVLGTVSTQDYLYRARQGRSGPKVSVAREAAPPTASRARRA